MTSTKAIPIVNLGDVVNFEGGGTPSKANDAYWDGTIPWASVKDISGPELSSTIDHITEEGLANSASRLVPAGNVILPTRMALGRAAINTVDVAINQDLRVAYPHKNLDRRYLLWFIISNARLIESLGSGATVKGITLDKLRNLQIPLPPLAEQKRIAAILDKADGIRRKLQQSLRLADDFLRSVFLDMFGDPVTNPNGWDTVKLQDAVKEGTIVTYGIVQAGPEFPEGVPYIRTGDIVNGVIKLDGLRRTDPSIAKKFDRSKMRTGEIVMSIRATVGTTAVVTADLDGANLTQGTARISPGENTLLPFLLYYLRSEGVQGWIQKQVKGATFAEITLSRLRELPVLIPPIANQKRFSAAHEKLEKVKAAQQKQLFDSSNLFSSLQQRAFRGEL